MDDWPVDMELSANTIDEVDINIGADENIIPPEDEGEIFVVNELIFSLVILFVEDGVNIAVGVTLCVEEGTTLKVDVMIFSMLISIQKYSKMWIWKDRREIN